MEDGGWRIENRSYFDLQSSIFNPPSSILHPQSSILNPLPLLYQCSRMSFGKTTKASNMVRRLTATPTIAAAQTK